MAHPGNIEAAIEHEQYCCFSRWLLKEQMYLYCCLGFYLELFLFGWLFSKMNLEIDVCRSCDLTITMSVVMISVTLRKVFLGSLFLF